MQLAVHVQVCLSHDFFLNTVNLLATRRKARRARRALLRASDLATVQTGLPPKRVGLRNLLQGDQKATKMHAKSTQITGFRAGQYLVRNLTMNRFTYPSPMPVSQGVKCVHLAGPEWAIRKAKMTKHTCGNSSYSLRDATVIFSFVEIERLQKPFHRSVSELFGALFDGL